MADLVLFGAGDIARLARHYFDTDSDHDVVAYTVDAAYRDGREEFDGLPLVDFERVASRFPPGSHAMFIAMSYADMNRVRQEKCRAASEFGYELVSYVSSRCTYLSSHTPGANCFILEDNTVQPFVRIGQGVTLWSGNHIGHDSVIGDNVFITSHVVVSGNCRVGDNSFIGVNATLHDSVTLGEATLVAAGATIAKDTQPGELWVPARSVKLDRTSDTVAL